MCEPTTVIAATSVVGTLFSVDQAMQQSDYQSGVSKYQAGVNRYNARVSENEAQKTREAGTEKELAHRRKVAGLVSTQRTELAAAGVDIESGSPLQLQEDTALLGEVDAMRIRSNTDDSVEAHMSSAELSRSSAKLNQSNSESLKKSKTGKAVGSLLSGGSMFLGTGVADKWLNPASVANL